LEARTPSSRQSESRCRFFGSICKLLVYLPPEQRVKKAAGLYALRGKRYSRSFEFIPNE
jgi:hypothetical protein